LAAGKELVMDGEKMIAIDTREIPWEEGYNEKLGRMLYSRCTISDAISCRGGCREAHRS
jgi:hypothetical protein